MIRSIQLRDPLVAEYHRADLTEGVPDVGTVDAVVHLAGLAAVGPSFDDPQRYLEVNSGIMTHLGEWLVDAGSSARVVVVSTGAVYEGQQPQPLSETSAVRLGSPYVISKRLVEMQAEYYRTRGIDVVVARPFNHIGPGQVTGFLIPDLYAQLVGGGEVAVGNLSSSRDYTDVRDVCRAYRLLTETPSLAHGLYNVCSGQSVVGHEILRLVAEAVGRDDVATQTDAALLRPDDASAITGSAARLHTETGWKPQLTVEESIADFVAAQA